MAVDEQPFGRNRTADAVRGIVGQPDQGDTLTTVGDELADALSRIARAPQRAVEDGEYLGADGLIYCAACRAAKQCRIPNSITPGETLRYPVTCECERRAIQAEIAEEKRRESMDAIARLRNGSLMTDRLTSWTFDRWEPVDETCGICKRYAANFDRMLRANQGLLLYGPPGTGKTFAAACIANALLERGVPVLMTSMVRLMAALNTKDDNDEVALSAMRNAKLLVIDDLGAERDTGYGLEAAYKYIDARYRDGKPMILTTNLSLDDMRREDRIGYRRIFDRVIENCYPIEFLGKSRRVQEAARRYGEMKNLLEG